MENITRLQNYHLKEDTDTETVPIPFCTTNHNKHFQNFMRTTPDKSQNTSTEVKQLLIVHSLIKLSVLHL